MLNVNFATGFFVFPKLPIGSVIFGLPANDWNNISISDPQHYLIQKSKQNDDIIITTTTPITNDNPMYFTTTEQKLFTASKTITSLENIVNYNQSTIIQGAYISIDCEKWISTRLYVDNNINCFVDEKSNIYLCENCYIAFIEKKITSFIYNLKLLPLQLFPHFIISKEQKLYNDINTIIKTIPIPTDIINKCYDLFLINPTESTIMQCADFYVKIPNYLSLLIEHNEIFNQINKIHEINYQSVKTVVILLLDLVMRKQLPNAESIIQNRSIMRELLYVSTYLNIPIFIILFNRLVQSLG